MCSLLVPSETELFEMGGMSSLNDERPIVEIRLQFGNCDYWDMVVTSGDGDVLVRVKIDDWLLQVNIDGKLVSSVHRRGLGPTQHRLKQNLVHHTFFPTLGGYVVNASPFM